MARAALIALCLCTRTAPAAPLTLDVGLGDGVGWAARAGAYRDDGSVALRVGAGLTAHLALELGLREDLERLEPAFGIGARYALDPALYLRGELALVGASQLGSNFDATAAIGYASGDTVGWYVELAAIDRFGELATVSLRGELGIELRR